MSLFVSGYTCFVSCIFFFFYLRCIAICDDFIRLHKSTLSGSATTVDRGGPVDFAVVNNVVEYIIGHRLFHQGECLKGVELLFEKIWTPTTVYPNYCTHL